MDLRPNTKANVYVFSNMFVWVVMSVIAVWTIHRFIGVAVFRYILYPAAVVGLAYFEERIFCRVVGRIVAFVIHDEDVYGRKR